MKGNVRQAAAVVAMAVTGFLTGCATWGPQGPSEHIRAQFGTIGVAAPRLDIYASLRTLPKGVLAEAWHGAGVGALDALEIASAGPTGIREADAVILGAILVMLPFTTVAGSVNAALDTEPQSAVLESEGTLRSALADLNFRMQETMLSHFLREARARSNYDLVALNDPTAASFGGIDDNLPVSHRKIDTYLDLSVESVELVRGIMHHPNFALALETRIKISRAEDGAVLYDTVFPYESYVAHSLDEWSADGGRLLAEEWRYAVRTTARKIVNEVFLWYRLS